ncbi:MAG: SH3 domain-containing protein [Novosphingobium sp.]|uniref:SH3 domain-containing protein n=1 Tax=Tsuneonella sp. CC-YZS046 TaxID=3042152 RepID=UPI002D766D4F|nr:SH3 domain-containing protein [Tsuneonella sp. CC-YZS046]WRO66925.1 SH3 domain-containing protein [Tsuneonella sp. CC-YZS046]
MTDQPSEIGGTQPLGPFALSGPVARPETRGLPVRGDLAHIGLAGKYFVPHYAVPSPRRVLAGGATLRASGREDGEILGNLAAGEVFEVLDIAGNWAWGSCGPDGPVGYVALHLLEGHSE